METQYGTGFDVTFDDDVQNEVTPQGVWKRFPLLLERGARSKTRSRRKAYGNRTMPALV
jgi:hypothetical protein